MVRLKVGVFDMLEAGNPFQFHYGTIKSIFRRFFQRNFVWFQFHYGTIKSNGKEYRLYDGEFQFHYGTIKSGSPVMIDLDNESFNSTMVRLKVDFISQNRKVVR